MLRKEPNCLRDALRWNARLRPGWRYRGPVGSTLPRDRRGLTPSPATNNSLWTTHGILTLIRAPFFNAFVRLNIMGQLLLLKSIMYLYTASHQSPPFRDGHNRARGKATPVTQERGPYRLAVTPPQIARALPDPTSRLLADAGLVRME